MTLFKSILIAGRNGSNCCCWKCHQTRCVTFRFADRRLVGFGALLVSGSDHFVWETAARSGLSDSFSGFLIAQPSSLVWLEEYRVCNKESALFWTFLSASIYRVTGFSERARFTFQTCERRLGAEEAADQRARRTQGAALVGNYSVLCLLRLVLSGSRCARALVNGSAPRVSTTFVRHQVGPVAAGDPCDPHTLHTRASLII